MTFLNGLYHKKLFPFWIQIITLLFFVFIVIIGFDISTDDSALAKQLRNTNLANLIVWSYWWPLIIVSAVLFGRHWCTICPMELVTAVVAKFGFQRKVPKSIKSGWIITILYAFIAIVAIHYWAIHRLPHRMALYMIFLFGLSILVSIVFEKRAFCSYFCPVGKLLGIYALLAKVGIRIKSSDTCQNCKTKECISKKLHYEIAGRSCTSNLYPAYIETNNDCILCSQCIKVCPHQNIEYKKSKFSFSNNSRIRLNSAELGMILLLTGFVVYEILSSWKESKELLLWLPEYYQTLSISSLLPAKINEGIILFVLLPFVFLGNGAYLRKIFSKESLFDSWAQISLYILPVIAFAHIFKALLKTVSRIPYWQYSLKDFSGEQYAQQIVDGIVVIPKHELLSFLILIIGLLLLLYGFIIGIRRIMQTTNTTTSAKYISNVIVLVYFSVLASAAVIQVINHSL
ncbi:MAG: 4Fe-4S binding protein [Bacteroidetes bacterium]|nr:4Fe-4S binding protein [Bacteroidota bacterium]